MRWSKSQLKIVQRFEAQTPYNKTISRIVYPQTFINLEALIFGPERNEDGMRGWILSLKVGVKGPIRP